MLPACAPFYMGLAAGWGVLVSKYVEHSGAPCCLHHTASVPQCPLCSAYGSQEGWHPVESAGSCTVLLHHLPVMLVQT